MNRPCSKESPSETARPDFVDSLVESICRTYEDKKGINHVEGFNLPQHNEVLNIIHTLMEIIFPGFSGKKTYTIKAIRYTIGEMLSSVYVDLADQIFRSFRYRCETTGKCKGCDIHALSSGATETLLGAIPEIRETLKLDIEAAYGGDPAAMSNDEIVMSYPGLKTIAIQRMAHVLYHQDVPLIPRMMTEYAHSITGIDIHPGAHLGKGIFIDHGTGVVIGETAEIGDNAKIYQGVTLGALSFPKDACGKIIKGAKRHPTLEDNVTIYSGATVLGNIVIGKGSVIGGNVWLTESVEPGTRVTIAKPDLTIKTSK